ncbi:polyketide cyclase [Halobiforma lacisalsi AJ5]|uniref:Polyketide cyclase n=1 Tax=Natronobacterium lacisalsi AJ5 TaxID=358396 RepID=M0L4X5_NATLA|nr:SRPBCC domain-containing protein [Halobiforma lacisalsi]APW98175.1 polyketide cyclase [Halobiforma lacisalsi AJ5]EMA28158.1 polyketide cyclase/dehydrase [Halobiforma lacisalsi AJ5]
MEKIETFEEIDAPPDVVWDVLLEFDSYPEWNPFIRAIEGDPSRGERLRVRIEPPESRGMTFRPTVIAVEPERRLAWRGRLIVPFVFDGDHEFHLEPIDDDRTRLLHRETFRGVLVPVLLDHDRVERGFEAMNEAVKERAERRAATETPVSS